MGGEAEASLYPEAAPCREAGTEAAGPSLSPKTRGAGAWGASGGGAVGPPGTGMEPGLETLTVGFQDRQGSPSQRRPFWAEVGGRRSGQGLRPGDRMGGREEGLGGTGAGRRCPEGGGDQSPSQRPDFPQKLPRIPKLRTLPSVGAGRRAQPPGSPGPRVPVPVPVPGSLSPTSSLPPSLCLQLLSRAHRVIPGLTKLNI